MKKRTVITTEKREVWVIHRPPASAVQDPHDGEREGSTTVPDLLSQGDMQTDTPTQIQIDEKH